MDKFPDNLTRQFCHDIIVRNQEELIKVTRKQFYEIIMNSVKNCDPEIILEFQDKLWHEHRITILKELWEKFGKVKIKTINSACDVTKTIINIDDTPTSIRKIIIDMPKSIDMWKIN